MSGLAILVIVMTKDRWYIDFVSPCWGKVYAWRDFIDVWGGESVAMLEDHNACT